MKHTIKLILALAVLCLLTTTPKAAAVTIDGHTFDSNSATLTNPYYNLDKHFYWLREDGQHAEIQYVIDKEIIAGVECAKVCHSNGGHDDYWWLAQDINKDIFLLKGRTNGYIWHDIENEQGILPWIGNPPKVGDHQFGYLNSAPFYQEIVDDNATFGSHTGCVKLNRSAANGHEWDIYFKSGFGIVGFNYRDHAFSPWIRHDRVYDTGEQAEHPPAILPEHWVGAYFRTEFYGESNHVDMKHDIAVVDRDGMGPLGSHYVTMTFPDGTTWNVPPDIIYSNYVEHWMSHAISSSFSGTMTYYVYDAAGNQSAPFFDDASYGTLPIVDYSTIQISPDGTTPTISWNAPVAASQEAGIAFYRVRVTYPGQGESCFNGYTKETHYKIPPGAFEPDTEYQVAIIAHAEHDGQNRNVASWSARVSFTTDHVSQAPYTDLSFYPRGARVYYSPRNEAPLVNFYLRVHDAQGVPDNIDSVTVQVPGVGSLPLFFQSKVNDTEGRYRTNYYHSIPAGIYTFTIADKDGHIFSASQNFNPQPMQAVSKSSMSPPNNTVISGDSVTFSWDPVVGASLYELGIIDSEGNWLDSFNIAASSSPQITIGSGYFKKNEHYHWMVNAVDGFWDQSPQYISAADWEDFGPSIMNGRLNGSNDPSISLAGYGTYINTDEGIDPSSTSYWLSHYIEVVDPDGAPGNIAAVTVRYPDGTTKDMYIDSSLSDTEVGFYLEEPLGESLSGAQSGDYIYTVIDNEGKTASVTDSFTLAPLERIKDFGPKNGAVLPVNGVILSCSPVKDAVKYRYRLRNHWGSGFSYRSGYVDSNSHIIPQSELAEDWIYRIRIEAYRENREIEDVDNRSVSQYKQGRQNYFLTTPAASSATGTLDFPAGVLAEEYRIAALPLSPDNPDPTATLNIPPEDYDPKYMRLGQWNTETQDYDEYPDFSPLGPGDAFWALFREERSINLIGTETATVDHPTLASQKAYRRPIVHGWNMLGNPFPYTIGIGDIVLTDTPGQYATISEGTITQPVFWIFRNGNYEAASTLGTGEGGWIKKTTLGAGSIYFAAIQRDTDSRAAAVQDNLEKPPPPPGSLGTSSSGSSVDAGGGCYIDAISVR